MPHLFVNRARRLAVLGREPDARADLRWETVNTTVYLVGGALFVWGSILFFPALESRSDRGAWIFFFASLAYVVVAGHDLVEVVRHRTADERRPTIWDRFETWASFAYLLGSLLFAVGSVLFLSSIDRVDAGASCFVAGSLCFVLGATVNVLQIVQAADLRTLQLMNLTALTFVTGSILFVVASVPYLFDLRSAADERTIDAFLAAQYVAGSVLFLLGGSINYWRARLVARRRADER